MPTFPGINSKFPLLSYSQEEQAIIQRFARYFYITRSVELIQTASSAYSAFLMRPAEGISTILNVEHEIVVLFAPYETFEARTLAAYDTVYAQFDDNRVDRTVRILISRDVGIVKKIRHFLERDPEYPVIIPYTYSDFKQATDNFILSSVRSNYLIRDLFGYQSPLKQEYFFFGRDKLLNHVIDVHKAGQNSSLFGLRKSGKTSTIYAIQRRAKALGCHSVSVDCQDPAVHARGYADLLLFILNEVRRSFGLKLWQVRLGDRPDEVSEHFRDVLKQTLASGRSDVLLIFDEIENISPRTAASHHWRSGRDTLLFWQILRSFFQQAGKYKITFCFVGTNPHLFETPKLGDVDNPVYLFAPRSFLPPLSQSDVAEMCKKLGYYMGLDFDFAISSRIHSLYGGHPFFTRQLCSRIHQIEPVTRPISVSVSKCGEAERQSAGTIRGYVKEILDSLKSFYPDEYELLSYLAHNDVETFNSLVEEYPEFVDHLIGYGIIAKRGNDYEFQFEAVKDALISCSQTELPATTEGRWREVNERRNLLEVEVRSALYHWAQELSEDQWESACLSCIPKHVERMGNRGRRYFFSKSQSPLYLLDLMKLVEFSGRFSSSQEDGSAISAAFDVVNRLRTDAHAKTMSDDEYTAWLRAISLLEDRFLPPA
jgi:hypothetical protein